MTEGDRVLCHSGFGKFCYFNEGKRSRIILKKDVASVAQQGGSFRRAGESIFAVVWTDCILGTNSFPKGVVKVLEICGLAVYQLCLLQSHIAAMKK